MLISSFGSDSLRAEGSVVLESESVSFEIASLSKDVSEKGVSSGPRVTADSIQDILNRFSDFVAQLHQDPQSTQVGPKLKWSDLVDGEESSRMLNLPNSLVVTKSSGASSSDNMTEHGLQTQATDGQLSREEMGFPATQEASPNPVLKENGSVVSEIALDTGDRNLIDTNQRFQFDRGGYQGRGRDGPSNFRGGRGGRGVN
ncbi:hypothetical protein ACSBR1_021416 [Camellia fascicularis]